MTTKKKSRKSGLNADVRDSRGRFGPGNPGKPKGTRNRVTVAIEQIILSDAEGIARTVINKAKRGYMPAALAILRTLVGPARDRAMPISFPLPPLEKPEDVLRALNAIAAGTADGRLDVDGARVLVDMVNQFRQAFELVDHEQRLAAIERQQKAGAAHAQ